MTSEPSYESTISDPGPGFVPWKPDDSRLRDLHAGALSRSSKGPMDYRMRELPHVPTHQRRSIEDEEEDELIFDDAEDGMREEEEDEEYDYEDEEEEEEEVEEEIIIVEGNFV